MVLDKMPDDPVKNRIYDLMKLHLSILEGKGDLEEKIPEDASKEPLLIAQGYVWYLQAFYDKEEETIIRSRDEIKELYDQCEDGKIKGYLFWLYMNLSEELMKDAKLRMELIKELYQEGCQNPLLQFEGCCILGEDEQLLDEIDSYELWVLEFGAEEKILNSKLIGRICFLISRNKVFSEEVLWLFLCIYKEYRQSDVLQGICALMIQGNCMDEDCHPYYEEALQRGVQLIGLQEAFLRTIPKGQYPLLPEEILRYFTYSKSLGKEDQSRPGGGASAVLYAAAHCGKRFFPRVAVLRRGRAHPAAGVDAGNAACPDRGGQRQGHDAGRTGRPAGKDRAERADRKEHRAGQHLPPHRDALSGRGNEDLQSARARHGGPVRDPSTGQTGGCGFS